MLSVGEGRALADGTLVKPAVKEGDIVLYNPHMFQLDYKDDEGRETVIVNALAIYGRIA